LQYYPNPATGVVNIETDFVFAEIMVSVYNDAGEKILQRKYYHNEMITFDLSEYSSGLYIVRIDTGHNKITRNVILNKLK
jgi:hypothetical protein